MSDKHSLVDLLPRGKLEPRCGGLVSYTDEDTQKRYQRDWYQKHKDTQIARSLKWKQDVRQRPKLDPDMKAFSEAEGLKVEGDVYCPGCGDKLERPVTWLTLERHRIEHWETEDNDFYAAMENWKAALEKARNT